MFSSRVCSLLSFVVAIAPFWSPVGPLVIKVLNDNLASKFHITCGWPYNLLSKPGPFWQWNGHHWWLCFYVRQAPRPSQINQDTALLLMGSFYPGPDDFLTLRRESVPEKLHQTEIKQARKTLLKIAAKRERDWRLLGYNRDGWGCVASEQEGSQRTEDYYGELLRYEGHGNPC